MTKKELELLLTKCKALIDEKFALFANLYGKRPLIMAQLERELLDQQSGCTPVDLRTLRELLRRLGAWQEDIEAKIKANKDDITWIKSELIRLEQKIEDNKCQCTPSTPTTPDEPDDDMEWSDGTTTYTLANGASVSAREEVTNINVELA